MTREEATARCEQLNADRREGRRWFARQTGPEEWEVVSAQAPGLQASGPTKAAIETKPRPPEPPDPRPTIIRNVPPYGA